MLPLAWTLDAGQIVLLTGEPVRLLRWSVAAWFIFAAELVNCYAHVNYWSFLGLNELELGSRNYWSFLGLNELELGPRLIDKICLADPPVVCRLSRCGSTLVTLLISRGLEQFSCVCRSCWTCTSGCQATHGEF